MKQKRQAVFLDVLIAIAAAVLLAIAASVWYTKMRGPTVAADNFNFAQGGQLLAVENPGLHVPEMEKTRKTEYKSSGRNPFIFQAVAHPPPQTVKPDIVRAANTPCQIFGPCPEVKVPIPPPPPPPVKFYGYGTVPNGSPRLAFFLQGDDIFIVAEGQTFLGHYRLIKINNSNLEYEETTTSQRGTAPLEDQSSAGGLGPS